MTRVARIVGWALACFVALVAGVAAWGITGLAIGFAALALGADAPIGFVVLTLICAALVLAVRAIGRGLRRLT